MHSQKRLLLPGLILAVSLGLANAQLNTPFTISGPDVVCPPQLCQTYSIATSLPPGSATGVFTAVWSNGDTSSHADPSTVYCFSGPGSYTISAVVTTANGQTFQTPPRVVTVPQNCSINTPVEIISNAAEVCQANAGADPPLPPADGFALFLPDRQGVAPGQQVCMSVTTQNFTNILGLQFSIHYDPARLQFVSVGNLGLPGLSVAENFGLPIAGSPGVTAPGVVTMYWQLLDGGGLTLPDSSVLFELCFIALPGACSTDVVFSDTPTHIEVTNGNEQIVPFFSRSGRVRFSSGATGGNPSASGCCEKVCEGATVRYRLSGYLGSLAPVWSIRGAQSFVVDSINKSVEVVWGAAGQGLVIVSAGNAIAQLCVDILAIPQARFSTSPAAGGDTLFVCRDQSVAFTNTSTGGSNYRWLFGDGSSSPVLDPAYSYTDAGTFRIALVAENECFCADTAFLVVVVSPSLAPQLTCRGTVCEGAAVTYTTDADCGTFLWSVDPNGTVTGGGGISDNFITIDWHTGPEGTVQLQIADCANADYCPEPNAMRVPILSPNARITGPEQVCRSQAARYSITRYGGTEFTWTVSSMGSILSGQGANEVRVQWGGLLSAQPQWVAVQYDNCYLGCGGRDTIWVNIRPEFTASGPVETCLNTAQTYTARRSDTGVNVPCNWEARTSDGNVAWTSPVPTATPTVPWDFGAGRYRLIAHPAAAADFCTPVYEISVLVLDPPPALSGITGPTVICPGLPYTYTATGTLPGHVVGWAVSGNSGAGATAGNPLNITWGAAPPYALSVRQISPQGCISEPFTLDASNLPGLSVAGPAEVCAEETSLYSAPDFARLDYAWSIVPADAGTILEARDTSFIRVLWHKAGPAGVNLAACGQSVSLPVTVRPRPVPEVLHPAMVCAGDSALVQTAQSYASWSWRNAAGAEISTAAMPRLPAGYYTLEANDAQGCTATALFQIENFPAPAVSISTPDNAGICPGDPPSTLFALNSEAGYAFQWYRDGAPVAGANAVTFSTTQLGDYQVEVIDANGCSALSPPLNLFFYCAPGGGGGFPGGGFPGGGGPPPGPCPPNTLIRFDILPDPDCHVSNYQNTSPAFVPGSLLWNFGDPASGTANTSTLENPSHTFSRAGFFRVFLSGSALNPGPEPCYAIRVDTVPVAPAFHFERACEGTAMPFTDASTLLPGQSILSRNWDFGDPASGAANTSTDTNPTHIFAAPGLYTVTLTVVAANGCTASASREVEVLAAPPAAFDLPAANCAASATPFVANVGTDVVAVRWNFGNPAAGAADSSSLREAFHRYETPGTYTVTLEATDVFGCSSRFNRDVLIEPNGLGGAIAFISPICEGDSSLLRAPVGGIRWQWSTGDTTETIRVRREGVYSVVMTNANGCSYQPADAVVRVIPSPENAIRAVQFNNAGLPQAYTYDSLSVCAGEDVFLELLPRTGQTYQWSTGSTSSRIEFSENRGNLLPVGAHEIFVTVTQTSTGCRGVLGPYRIIVRPLPGVPLVTAMPAGDVCEGTPVTFSVSNPQAGVVYSWSSGAVGASLTTSRPGQYAAIATNEWGCTNAAAPRSILPGPEINLIPSGCHSRCNPDTLCFPPVPGVNAYQWFFNGAAQGPVSATAPRVVIQQSGAYYMRMTTAQGCTLDSDPLTVDLFDGFGRIAGTVYWDRNGNGMYDAADSLMANVPFILLSGNVPLDTVRSQSDGRFGFVNILSAGYGLQLDTSALPLGLIADTVRIDTALAGCDVEVLVNWRLRCISSSTALTLEVCPGNTADYNGTPLAIGITTDFTFTNAAGCDSIVTVTVAALPPDTASLTLSACPGSTVNYNGTELAPGATSDFTFTNAAGCDSIVRVTVIALPAGSSALTLSACPGSTVNYNGAALSPGTTTAFTLATVAGCDSVVTVTVNALSTSATDLILSACPGSAVSYNGMALAPGTTTNFTFINASGCDSIVTVTVNALPAQTTSLSLQVCPGGTATYNGVALSPGTVREFTFPNSTGCDSVVTVSITAYPGIQVQTAVQASCPARASGSISTTSAGQGPFLYSLNGGAFTPDGNFAGLASGSYELLVEDANGCGMEFRVLVEALPPLLVAILNTELPCDAESITLEARLLSGDDGQVRYLWDNGAAAPQRSVGAPGDYRLTVVNGCDTLSETVAVRYAGRPDVTPVFVPNAFSPNDDGINDRFRAFASAEVTVQSFELMVFDRWGNLMFRTENIEEGWNGVFRERAMDPAVFVWWLRATVLHCGRVMELDKKGDVTLVR